MKSETVYLRCLELSDLEKIYKWQNNPTLYESLIGPFRQVSMKALEEWLQKKMSYSNNEINFAICLTTNSEHIGNIYLRNIDWISRQGELSIFIGEAAHRRKGYGQEAVSLIYKHAFKDLGLRRIYLYTLANNAQAIHLYEKVGFIKEGILRKHVLKKGDYKDVVVMGLCAEDNSF